MTLLNLDYKFENQPMFFGENLGLQLYNNVKYRNIENLYNTQRGYFWIPDEISLIKDKMDYYTFNDYEKHIYTSNLKYQILLDSLQSRSVASTFLSVCSLPEIEKFIILWSFFEQIHSESYSHIIKNVYSDSDEVFKKISNDQSIIERSKNVTKYYDNFYNLINNWNSSHILRYLQEEHLTKYSVLYELKEALYLAMVNVNILESIRFYSSFACSFAFSENKKMMGSASIISLIARDEACFAPGHEVLTPNGWKKIEEITLEDKVAQYNQNRQIEFVHPQKVIVKKHEGELIRFSDLTQNIDFTVTPDHRVIYDYKNKIVETTADNFCFNNHNKLITGGLKIDGESQLTDLQILYLFYYFCNTNVVKSGDKYVVNLYIKLKHDIGQCYTFNILKNLNIEYKVKKTYKELEFEYIAYIPESIFKQLNLNLFNYENLNYLGLRKILEYSYYYHLGSTHFKNTFKLKVKSENHAIFFKTVCAMTGHKCKINTNSKSDYIINVDGGKLQTSTPSLNYEKTVYNYIGQVYCLTVPSGMLLVKNKSNIVVSGNCHNRFTENVIKNWYNNDEPVMLEIIKNNTDVVVDMYKECIDEELAWIDYLFVDGSIIGLNKKILTQYLLWNAAMRMKTINVTPWFEYPTSNPIPWINNYLKSSNLMVAPQEKEIISYVVSNTSQNVDINSLNLSL